MNVDPNCSCSTVDISDDLFYDLKPLPGTRASLGGGQNRKVVMSVKTGLIKLDNIELNRVANAESVWRNISKSLKDKLINH